MISIILMYPLHGVCKEKESWIKIHKKSAPRVKTVVLDLSLSNLKYIYSYPKRWTNHSLISNFTNHLYIEIDKRDMYIFTYPNVSSENRNILA